MKNSQDKEDRQRPSASFVIGAVALLFLIVGYQAAIFIHHAAVTKIVADHDSPDTVYVLSSDPDEDLKWNSRSSENPSESRFTKNQVRRRFTSNGYQSDTIRISSSHTKQAEAIRKANTPRRYESFRFNPNTASVDDLMRLGFSEKQARSIDNYRQKGGRFRRKSDFAKSYVVADSVYQRLEKYIDIPKIDLNRADSATFETLPGIGKYFAAKMVSYRKELGGYSYPEQLMDIWHFDEEKYDALKDLIAVGAYKDGPYKLWTLPEAELARHPYIGKQAAHGIIVFRENSPKSDLTVENLMKAGILDSEKGNKLARCRIADP